MASSSAPPDGGPPQREDRGDEERERRGSVVRLDHGALAIRDVGIEREHDGRYEKRHGPDRDPNTVHVRIEWRISGYQLGVPSATQRCRPPRGGIARGRTPLPSMSGIAHLF